MFLRKTYTGILVLLLRNAIQFVLHTCGNDPRFQIYMTQGSSVTDQTNLYESPSQRLQKRVLFWVELHICIFIYISSTYKKVTLISILILYFENVLNKWKVGAFRVWKGDHRNNHEVNCQFFRVFTTPRALEVSVVHINIQNTCVKPNWGGDRQHTNHMMSLQIKRTSFFSNIISTSVIHVQVVHATHV